MSTKKIVLLVALLLPLWVMAQRNPLHMDRENFFRFGVKAGLNVNKINGKTYKEGYHFNYQAGAFAQINFSRRLGLQPEINFVQTAAEFSNDPSDIYYDLWLNGSQRNAKLNYLEVPVLLNLNIGTSKRVKLQAGPAYGSLLKETVDSLAVNGNIYKKAEWSAIAGLWIQLPTVNMGTRYKIGLSDINAIDNRQEWKSEALQIFVGLTF